MTTASFCFSGNCSTLVSLVIIVVGIWPGVKCTSNIQLRSDAELILNQPVQFECTVSGSTSLVIRILRDNGVGLGSITYATIFNQPRNIGSFTIVQSPGSIAGRISFTVESDIFGYTIICEDGLTMKNVNFTISLSSLGQQVTTISVILPTTTLTTTTTSIVPEPFVTLTNAISSQIMTSSLNYTPLTVTSSIASDTVSSSHSSIATSSSSEPSISVESTILCTPCPVESTESLSSFLLVAGISVAITVPVTAIITAIITIIIMYLLCIKHNKQCEKVLPDNNDYETPVELDIMTHNIAYGQVRTGNSYEGQSDAFKIYY